MTLSQQLDSVINQILLKAENQHELLIGGCQSEVKLTNTQEHILMLLSQQALTNSELAKQLKVSQAAVTKAVKSLVEKGLLETTKHSADARVLQMRLTAEALPIAEEHAHHHASTLSVYDDMLATFTAADQETIGRFLEAMSQQLED